MLNTLFSCQEVVIEVIGITVNHEHRHVYVVICKRELVTVFWRRYLRNICLKNDLKLLEDSIGELYLAFLDHDDSFKHFVK